MDHGVVCVLVRHEEGGLDVATVRILTALVEDLVKGLQSRVKTYFIHRTLKYIKKVRSSVSSTLSLFAITILKVLIYTNIGAKCTGNTIKSKAI